MSDTKDILDKVAKGEMTPEEAELQLKMKPFVDLGFAKPDLQRLLSRSIRSRQAFLKAARRLCSLQGCRRRKKLSFRLP